MTTAVRPASKHFQRLLLPPVAVASRTPSSDAQSQLHVQYAERLNDILANKTRSSRWQTLGSSFEFKVLFISLHKLGSVRSVNYETSADIDYTGKIVRDTPAYPERVRGFNPPIECYTFLNCVSAQEYCSYPLNPKFST